MSRLRWPQRLYIGAVMLAAVLALGTAALRIPPLTLETAVIVAILFAMSALAQVWPVHISVKMKMTVDDLPNFAAALLLGPFASMAIAAASTLVGLRHRQTKMRWYNRAFNASASSLSTGAAALAFLVLGAGAPPSFDLWVPIAVAAAVKYLVQVALVDIVVALQLRRNPLASWWELHSRDIPNEAALMLLGAIAAVVSRESPGALAVFAVPMAITLKSLRDSARIRQDVRAAILELADLIDLRDPYTHGHSQRVASYAERLARRIRLEPSQIELVRDAARVHDIGKIATNDMVLLKPGPLTPAEQSEMQLHTEHGHRLLRRLPEFWEGAELVLMHHERHDGRGYPRGIGGEDLPVEASVISVADTYDAMTTDRPYRRALPWPVVRSELLKGRDSQWRGNVVDAFVAMIEEQRRMEAPATATIVPLVAAAE